MCSCFRFVNNSARVVTRILMASFPRYYAGKGDHRFIGIWFVVVKDRVMVRSWSVEANGWYRTFLREPCGTIQIGVFEIPRKPLWEAVR
jgi:hypothetical protein